MSRAVEFVTLLTLAAVMSACRGDAEGLPSPTNVSCIWLDRLTVNVSWLNPIGKKYIRQLEKPISGKIADNTKCGVLTHFTAELLTENIVSGEWTYLIWTVEDCDDQSHGSPKVLQKIKIPEPRAEVNDIKCLMDQENASGMNCSWIPGDQPLTLSYRSCFKDAWKKDNKFKPCNRTYSGPTRNGCYLDDVHVLEDTCMLFETREGFSTFQLKPMLEPPELSVIEEGGELKLSWPQPNFAKHINCWNSTVCYSKCNHSKECRSIVLSEMRVPYDKSCRYDFWSSFNRNIYCPNIFSNRSKVVSYGTNEPADKTLTVLAIVLPIILSLCLFLSIYCFRRYSSIICPVIPDPSAIFKEMMMNGNKELKTTETLYVPVPEPIESCRVDPVPDYMLIS
ncbi:interleukin-13 receptor subunit alpha-1-like isoform 2-T2 [Spinachia spinachia]